MHVPPVYLTNKQTDKLRRVLEPTIPIYPSPVTSSFPTLHITPKDFLREVYLKLREHSIDITAVRLYGGAASYVLVSDSDFVYRDIDILFLVKTPLSSEQQTTLFSSNNEPYLCDVWTIIKYTISSCLIEHIPNASTCTQYFVASVLDTYTKKNIKISSEQDSWALLSLQNLLGKNLELKFVEHLKRQWQFSVDSFQIDLKPILLETPTNRRIETKSMQTSGLIIGAINSVNIVQSGTEDDQTTSISESPIQFGSISPSSLPKISEPENSLRSNTLGIITTIETTRGNIASSESRVRSSNRRQSTNDCNQKRSSLQFALTLGEDVDDGIEVDADDSPNEDDDLVFCTPSETKSSSPVELSMLSTNLIEVFSIYKDLHEALYHLNHRLIATYEPETMRGGGLLKYCDLLSRNYTPYDLSAMLHIQRYMCSRFCIDYKTISEQLHVITQYVATHFLPSTTISDLFRTNNMNELLQRQYNLQSQCSSSKKIDSDDLMNARLCLIFFEKLLRVIDHSTVCLTHDDKALLLTNIHWLKEYYHREYEYLFYNDQEHYRTYHAYNQMRHHYSHPSSQSSRSSSPSNVSSRAYATYRGHSHRNFHNQRQYANMSYYHGTRT